MVFITKYITKYITYNHIITDTHSIYCYFMSVIHINAKTFIRQNITILRKFEVQVIFHRLIQFRFALLKISLGRIDSLDCKCIVGFLRS